MDIKNTIPVNTALTQSGIVVDYSYEIKFNGCQRVDLAMAGAGSCWVPEFSITLTPAEHKRNRDDIVAFLRGFDFRPAENASSNEEWVDKAKAALDADIEKINDLFNRGLPVNFNSQGIYFLSVRQVVRGSHMSLETAIAERKLSDGAETKVA